MAASLLPAQPAARAQAAADNGLPARPHRHQSLPDEPNRPPVRPETDLWTRETLLGDAGGVRSALARSGISFKASSIEEVLGNPVGGLRQAVAYEGLTRLGMRIDTEKAFGLVGGTFEASGVQIHGRGLSAKALGNNTLTVSGIEAPPAIMLAQLWYEQSLAGGKVAIRAGQLLADLEFTTSSYAGTFVNSTFGWPALWAANLPAGGPSYPHGVLGVRIRATPSKRWTLFAAAFNGSPLALDRLADGASDRHGTAFRLGDGLFLIGEAQYAAPGGKGLAALPGVYKVGGWHNSRRADGTPSASRDAGAGDTRRDSRRGNWSLYAVADQLLLLERGTKDQGLAMFARIMAGPGGRNPVSAYADAGLTYKGTLPGRHQDTVGVAVASARFAGSVITRPEAPSIASSRATGRSETVVEISYQAVIAPWWQVQPSVQYVANPRGADPASGSPRPRDALILGLRTNIQY